MTVSIDDILGAMVEQVESLDFILDDAAVPVDKVKIPLKAQGIDPDLRIVVCPSATPGPVRPFAFKKVEVTHLIDLAIIAPNANDQLSNLPEYAGMVRSLLLLFSKPPAWSLATRKVTSRPTSLFDRKALAELKLDILTIEVAVTVVERVAT